MNQGSIQYEQQNPRRLKRKHLIFVLGEKRHALPLSKVKEVIGMTNITPLPRVPNFYRGLINLRGQIISVIDLRTKLGFKSDFVNPKRTSIIISYVGDILLGSIVDEVIEVIGYQDDMIDLTEASRVERSGDGIYGVAKDDDGALTLLLDIQLALDKTEFKVLKEQIAG